MEAPQSPKKMNIRPRSRVSIAHTPTADELGEKENLTVDAAGLIGSTAKTISAIRKSRSKSLGPGGFDALHSDAGNRQWSPATPQYKSILKSTIPLSPPKAIPPRTVTRVSTPVKSRRTVTPEKVQEGLLIDVSTPKDSLTVSKGHDLLNPFGDPFDPVPGASQDHGRVAIRTEEEQHAAAKERQQQDIVARKDARRKSLANRRVSFAPEATLHTWDVVEMPEDSTTSSASTNTTRRASSLSAAVVPAYTQPQSLIPSSDASEPPSTPPQQLEEVQVTASPAHQRDLHQKKRRRSSGIPPMNFINPDEFSSSPKSVDSANSSVSDQTFMTADADADSSDSDDKDLVEDETITGIDGEDITRRSSGSFSTGSSGRLEEALRQAARQAGTQGIDHDENGDITMEMADEEVTAAFKPWTKKDRPGIWVMGNPSALEDQENINPFSPAFKAKSRGSADEDRQETMDLTQAVGAILTTGERAVSGPVRSPQKARSAEQLRRSFTPRPSSGASSSSSDETMDLTMAVGEIQQNQRTDRPTQQAEKHNVGTEECETTMQFTSVVGGILERKADNLRRESGDSLCCDEEMDYTVTKRGGILQSITERTEPVEDDTMGMDITTAIGAILPQQLRSINNAQGKDLVERETDNGQLSGSLLYGVVQSTPEANQPAEKRLPEHVRTVTSETGSPSLLVTEGQGSRRRSFKGSTSATPSKAAPHSMPLNKPATPSKQSTPRIAKPVTPGKTPPAKNISMRTGSPKILFEAEIKRAAYSPNRNVKHTLHRHNPAVSGNSMPSLMVEQDLRRSKGLGLDGGKMGSPRVTELLERRGSIVDSTEAYAVPNPSQANVYFVDPHILEQEVDHERKEDQRRESGLQNLPHEVNDTDPVIQNDATISLKDRIESLTPQKKKGKLNGRKSLHVGAARGLLGKRPAELDNNEDDEDRTPKRLRGRESSPVKKVRLPAPPTKNATTGRMTRSSRVSLSETEANARLDNPVGGISPMKSSCVTTSKGQLRFEDARTKLSPTKAARSSMLETESDAAAAAFDSPPGANRVHLQDFLNLTNIRFMELTTTKRRHTIAPNGSLDSVPRALEDGVQGALPVDAGSRLEQTVKAGACTLPMLDLYQHSCRELKKYITEGRSIVREIEQETFDENPPLFREYMTAPADAKATMDNQFKNVKTHARLLSKAMWYEWRMKLLDGLKEGLLKNGEGMNEDAEALTLQEQLIQDILPSMTGKQEQLEADARDLQAQADELASCDQEELNGARSDLVALEDSIAAKRKMAEELRLQLHQKEYHIENATERGHEYLAEIQEAEKVCRNSRGLDFPEIKALQVRIAVLEQQHGWAIISAADGTLTMTYQRTLQLYFSPHFFQSSNRHPDEVALQENAPIGLAYIADAREYYPQPLTTEKRFFLQIMRAQLQFLEQSTIQISELLDFVGGGWEKACRIAEEARILGVQYVIEPIILSDEVLAVRSVVLLRGMKTKVEATFEVGVRSGAGAAGIDVIVTPSARVVYGEELNGKKMGDFLEQKMSGKRKGKQGHLKDWTQTVNELEKRLLARGKKS